MTVDALKSLIQFAVSRVIEEDAYLLEIKVSERAICGALMLRLHDIIKNYPSFAEYSVDVEYNRRADKRKGLDTGHNVFCDLVLHKRGENSKKANLIALEMKKIETTTLGNRLLKNINSDKKRLEKMTRSRPTSPMPNEKKKFYYEYRLGVFCSINSTLKIKLNSSGMKTASKEENLSPSQYEYKKRPQL